MDEIKMRIHAPDFAKVVVPLKLVQAMPLLSRNNSKSKARSRLKIILEAQSFYLELKKMSSILQYKAIGEELQLAHYALGSSRASTPERENEREKSTKSSAQYRQQWNRTSLRLDKLCTSYYCIMSGSPRLRQEQSHNLITDMTLAERRQWLLAF